MLLYKFVYALMAKFYAVPAGNTFFLVDVRVPRNLIPRYPFISFVRHLLSEDPRFAESVFQGLFAGADSYNLNVFVDYQGGADLYVVFVQLVAFSFVDFHFDLVPIFLLNIIYQFEQESSPRTRGLGGEDL